MSEISGKSADIILKAFEAATDGNWPNTKNVLIDAGITGEEAEAAFKELADIAGISNPVTVDDF